MTERGESHLRSVGRGSVFRGARERQAVERLFVRAHRRANTIDQRNEAAGRAERRCLVCARPATMRERAERAHVFCAQRCQRSAWRCERFFALSGPGKANKSGRKRNEKRGRELLEWDPALLIWPDYMPDEVLCDLLWWSFGEELETGEEIEEMLELREVSPQFRRVMDECVLPRVTHLSVEILESINGATLERFTGLRTLTMYKRGNFDGKALYRLVNLDELIIARGVANRRHEPLTDAQMMRYCPDVTTLSISGPGLTDACFPLLGMNAVRVLELEATKFTNACCAAVPYVSDLTLGDNLEITDIGELSELTSLRLLGHDRLLPACIARLTKLRRLDIAASHSLDEVDENSRMMDNETLRVLTQLEDLDIAFTSRITDVAVRHLTNLTKLDLDSAAPGITDAVLRTLTRLRVLGLSSYQGVGADVHVFAEMGNLQALSLSMNVAVQGVSLHGLATLTYLNLKGAVQVGDADLAMLVGLRVLIVDRNVTLTDASLSVLTNLEVLSLETTRANITNAGVSVLLSLRVLDLSGNKSITAEGIAPLTRLEQLFLVRNRKIDLSFVAVPPYGVVGFPRLTHLALYHSLVLRDRERKERVLVEYAGIMARAGLTVTYDGEDEYDFAQYFD
jgi:Leucine-rich repeat (LRR) protein